MFWMRKNKNLICVLLLVLLVFVSIAAGVTGARLERRFMGTALAACTCEVACLCGDGTRIVIVEDNATDIFCDHIKKENVVKKVFTKKVTNVLGQYMLQGDFSYMDYLMAPHEGRAADIINYIEDQDGKL